MNRLEIEAARKAGILDESKAAELEAFLKAGEDPGAASDNESLRFLANFNDIFISIGLVFLISALMMAVGLLVQPFFTGISTKWGALGAVATLLLPVILVTWLMLEYFAGRRRLTLPSMTLATLFTLLTSFLMGLLTTAVMDGGNEALNVFSRGFEAVRTFGLMAALGGLLGAGIIYVRFWLPFSLFLIALSVALGLYTAASTNGNMGAVLGGGLSLIIGLATLCAAIIFDARDPERKTLASDNAFWLHFAAAPQIMLGLRGVLTGGGFAPDGPGQAIALLSALIIFGIVSLALNRRALIAAAILSFGLAIGVLVESAGGRETTTLMMTLLLLGGGIVLLGAGWKTARRLVLALMPKTGFVSRIFPPEPA